MMPRKSEEIMALFVLVGSKKAIGIAVGNNKTQKRNTMLAGRLGIK
jgi:hypothetical protein